MNKKAFIYGVSVAGENFTDRVKETRRLKMNFENGQNVILVSPRRMGKTSLVQKVAHEINDQHIKVVFMDIYDCRNEQEFYQKFATTVLRATATDFSFSLGLNLTDNNDSAEILNLPERIAEKTGKHIVVCIDEFQQFGEMQDSLTIQKRLRSVGSYNRMSLIAYLAARNTCCCVCSKIGANLSINLETP